MFSTVGSKDGKEIVSCIPLFNIYLVGSICVFRELF